MQISFSKVMIKFFKNIYHKLIIIAKTIASTIKEIIMINKIEEFQNNVKIRLFIQL
jgi:hypothetical protein